MITRITYIFSPEGLLWRLNTFTVCTLSSKHFFSKCWSSVYKRINRLSILHRGQGKLKLSDICIRLFVLKRKGEQLFDYAFRKNYLIITVYAQIHNNQETKYQEISFHLCASSPLFRTVRELKDHFVGWNQDEIYHLSGYMCINICMCVRALRI